MAYVIKGIQTERITWEYFQEAFQKKFVGTRYVEACRLKFIELKHEDKTVMEYKTKFLGLICYAQGMVTTE